MTRELQDLLQVLQAALGFFCLNAVISVAMAAFQAMYNCLH